MKYPGLQGTTRQLARWLAGSAIVASITLGFVACSHNTPREEDEPQQRREGPDGELMREQRRQVRTGLSVLIDDSLKLISGKRVGLITNQTGVDEHGRSGIDLLFSDQRVVKAGVRLVALFSPEHGIRGTEDRENLSDTRDTKTKLPIYSLYGASTVAPPDSALKTIEVLIIDLQDVGTRTWTYVGAMVFAMQAAGKAKIPVLVLDRPNPITGTHTEGAILDTALAELTNPARTSNGFSLWPMPLRHGLTMGELSLYFKSVLKLDTQLHVIPMRNWRRAMWYDQTGLPFVKPSPSLANLSAELMYPALVPFERTNVSVGRGTSEAFQRFGAPWLRADTVAKLLEDLGLTGVKFKAERFTPVQPGDSKYGGQNIPGIRIEITDRDLVQPSRVGAAILWAINKLNKDSLKVTSNDGFDERLGAKSVREAILSGTDPDAVMDRQLGRVVEFERDARKFHLYR